MVALFIYNIVLKTKKPNKKPYPKELVTYDDHLRQRRLDPKNLQCCFPITIASCWGEKSGNTKS
jgi:hypothetical protein